MAIELETIYRDITEVRAAVQVLETKFESELRSVARREWVHDLVRPMEQTVQRIETAVKSLTDDAKTLFDAHNELIKEKVTTDRKELEARTPLGLVIKYGPLVATMGGLIMLFRVIGTYFEIYVQRMVK